MKGLDLKANAAVALCIFGWTALAGALSSCQASSSNAPGANPPAQPELSATASVSAPAEATAPSTTESPAPSPLPTTSVNPAPSTAPSAPAAPSATAPAETPAAPAAPAAAKGDRILPKGNIAFQSGKATLESTPENDAVLGQLKQYLEKNPNVTLMRIEGHTDNVGSAEANLKLSGERALAIKNALVAQGVAAERLVAVAFGPQKPVADNATEEGRAKNRRTEFKIAKLFGAPYRGLHPLAGGTEFK